MREKRLNYGSTFMWQDQGGPEQLLGEINTIGHPIVRRAYGNWTSNGIINFQSYLNRLGF